MHEDCVELTKERFNIKNNKIFYDNIPLWGIYSNSLKEYEFGYYDPTKTKYPMDDPKYYMLVCVDNYGDNYHWGRWDEKEDLEAWLDNPYVYALYDKKDKILGIAFDRAEAMMKVFMDDTQKISNILRMDSKEFLFE